VTDVIEHDDVGGETGQTPSVGAASDVVASDSTSAETATTSDAPAEQPADAAPAEDEDDVTAAIAAAGENVEAPHDTATIVTVAEDVATPDASEPHGPEEAERAEGAEAVPADAETPGAEQDAAAAEPAAAATAAPEVATPTAPEAVADTTRASKVSIWPFLVYDALWLVFAGVLIWQFEQLPADVAMYESELYPVGLLVGVVLLAAGPLLILVSWVAAWGRPGSTKGRLLISALVRGSVATLVGVVIWWAALLVLDQLRLGMVL